MPHACSTRTPCSIATSLPSWMALLGAMAANRSYCLGYPLRDGWGEIAPLRSRGAWPYSMAAMLGCR